VIKIALRSFAHHRAAAIATGLVALVGTILVTGMMSLLGTGLAETTVAADRAFLAQFPLIMDGWTVAIVLFAMVSTISVAIGGRAGEIAGIRLIGASPRQVQQMLVIETAAITAITALPGLAGGYLVGWIVTRSIHSAGPTDAASIFAPGVLLPVLGVSHRAGRERTRGVDRQPFPRSPRPCSRCVPTPPPA
jgi:putative ABC transport system permease protein